MSGRNDEQREVGRSRLNRRALPLALGAVFLAGALSALFGDDGYFELGRLRRACAIVENDLNHQRVRNATLQRDIRRLQEEPLAWERIARERLGFARRGEVQFLLPKSVRSGSDRAPAAPRPFGPETIVGKP